MQNSRHIGVLSSFILCYFIFSGNTCFKTGEEPEESKCGPKDTWSKIFDVFAYRDRGVDASNIREFIYEDVNTPADICTLEEHVDVRYEVWLHDGIEPPQGLSITGKAYWSLFGRSTPLQWKPAVKIFSGDDNIGLKQAFPEGEGYIGLQLVVRFPTQGSSLVDGDYLKSVIKDLRIYFDYQHTKL